MWRSDRDCTSFTLLQRLIPLSRNLTKICHFSCILITGDNPGKRKVLQSLNPVVMNLWLPPFNLLLDPPPKLFHLVSWSKGFPAEKTSSQTRTHRTPTLAQHIGPLPHPSRCRVRRFTRHFNARPRKAEEGGPGPTFDVLCWGPLGPTLPCLPAV